MKFICFHRWNILKYDEGSTDVQEGKEAGGKEKMREWGEVIMVGREGGRDLRQRKIFRERAGKRGVLIEE